MSNSSTSPTLDSSTSSIASFSLSSSIPVITTSSDPALSSSPPPASSQLSTSTSTDMATSASTSSTSDPPTTISSSFDSSSSPSSDSSSSTPPSPPTSSSSSSSSSESPPPPTSPPPSSEPPPPSSSEPPPPSSSTTPDPPPSTTSPNPPPPSSSSSSSSLQVLPPLPSQVHSSLPSPRLSLSPPSSTFSSTVFVTTTNSLGQTTISAPSQVTAFYTITDTDGNVVTSTAVIANPTLGVDDRQRKTSTFFSNTGAVVAVFVLVGLAAASIFLWIFFALRRRRRTQRIEHDTAVSATLAAAGYGRSPLVDDDDDQRPQDKLEMQQRSNSGHAVPTTSSSGNLRNSRSSAGFLDSPTLEGQQFVLDSNNYQPVAQAPLPSGYPGPGNHNYSYPIPPEEQQTFNPYADYVLPGATAVTGGAYIATRTSSPPPPPGALQPLPPSPPPPSGSYHHAHSPSLEPLLADYYRREGTAGNVGSLGVGEEVSGTSLSSSSPPPPIVPPRNPLRGFGLSGDAAMTTIAGGYDGAGAPSSVYSTESAPLTNHQAPPPPGDDDDVSVLLDEDRPVLGVTNPDLKREGSRRTSLDS